MRDPIVGESMAGSLSGVGFLSVTSEPKCVEAVQFRTVEYEVRICLVPVSISTDGGAKGRVAQGYRSHRVGSTATSRHLIGASPAVV
jgi:hypothetical protein